MVTLLELRIPIAITMAASEISLRMSPIDSVAVEEDGGAILSVDSKVRPVSFPSASAAATAAAAAKVYISD